MVYTSGRSSVGRATAFQAVGRRFEPGRPLKSLVSWGLWALWFKNAELKEFSNSDGLRHCLTKSVKADVAQR